MKRFPVILLMLCLLMPNAFAETLTMSHNAANHPERQAFLAAHPDVKLSFDGKSYSQEADLARDHVSGAVVNDVLDYLPTSGFDVHAAMAAGYFADLSGSEYLVEEIAGMYPSVQDQLTWEGRLYAIPETMFVDVFAYAPVGWEKAGFTKEDVPDSFPALLSFLEAWCDRIEREPESGLCVFGDFDSSAYDASSYTYWLAEMMLNQQILQCRYAGVPLTFDGTFRALLERAQRIGQRLYRAEGRPVQMRYPLLQGATFFNAESMQYAVSLRLREEDPVVYRGHLIVSAVSADSDQQALAIDYLEARVRGLHGEGIRYQNDIELRRGTGERLRTGTQPVENSGGRAYYERLREEYEVLEARLNGDELTGDARAKAELRREQLRDSMENPLPANFWHISPEEAEAWRQMAGQICFLGPDAFASSPESLDQARQLLERFARGQLTSEQLCQELNRLADQT